jgi:hypothetical protein
MTLGIYIMAPEPILNLSHQSVCLYVYPLLVARQRLGKNITAGTDKHATIEELLDASFSVRFLSSQRRRFVPPRNFYSPTRQRVAWIA